MKLTVTFLLVTTATCLSAWQLDPDCGIKGPANFARIVGGIEAAPHEFPWFASGSMGCGASVINKDWLLTAAHCIVVNETNTYYLGINTTVDSQSTKRHSVKNFVHKKYHGPFPKPEYDIALVKLSESLPLGNASAHIGTICLPEPEPNIDALAGRTSIVCGLGLTLDPSVNRPAVRKVNVTIWNQRDCTVAYDTIPPLSKDNVTENMICAASYGKDSCKGDSGGPMMTLNRKTGRWQLTGIVSWGDWCAIPYHPGVYTRVAKFLDWIQDIITNN